MGIFSHERMRNDCVRVESCRRAIRKVVQLGDLVLDLGPGPVPVGERLPRPRGDATGLSGMRPAVALMVAGAEGGGLAGTGHAERLTARGDVPVSTEGEALLRVGVVSDTHGSLDPQLPFLLRGADRILHAGDIGGGFVMEELELVAPVTAVVGNTDAPCGFPERVGMELGGAQVVLTHIGLSGRALEPGLADYLSRWPARVAVFGHSHEPLCEERDGLILFNPGSAGRKRFRQPRCFGWMEVGGEELRFRVVSLEKEGKELLEARFPISPKTGPR